MNLESTKVSVAKSSKEIFDFLIDLQNFEQLMPENTQKFEVDGDSFLFGLKGMPEIRLVLKEKTEFSNITLGAASSKLPFTLSGNISELAENKSEVQLIFNGDFNPMMAMMVKKPLTKFIEVLAENISKL
ncbi:MAG: SRPBCC family protein [Polaribacter sp.]|jgi:carbon monoxide dehydrogenase subunit G|nr:SRPBCC family protein [Polaribacter sp.]MDG1953591.1 SRPBCC family protein [Polaribacter sp.]MDG2074369.1 SRPBCC family protein [Polaribacter sp.]